MPTLLEMCDLPIPDTVDGISLASDQCRDTLYGEHFEGELGTRMLRAGRFKLIYYATGNRVQLFDIEEDPRETTDLSDDVRYADDLNRLKALLVQNLYGSDEEWIRNGELVGLPEKDLSRTEKRALIDSRDLLSQRGLRFL